jgi:hypothetical protein
MQHIVLHLAVPLLVALAFYRRHWRHVALLLTATILVDLDHLLANPIYDLERCSFPAHGDLRGIVEGQTSTKRTPNQRRPIVVSRRSKELSEPITGGLVDHLMKIGRIVLESRMAPFDGRICRYPKCRHPTFRMSGVCVPVLPLCGTFGSYLGPPA